jgi:hypothetical protein
MIDAANSTVQGMLQDSDIDDEEDEDEGSWDLDDDGESCYSLHFCVIQ